MRSDTRSHIRRRQPLLALILALSTLAARPAWSGCGCAKPPPLPAPIRPAFAPPGAEITLFPPTAVAGAGYTVVFGSDAGAVEVAAGAELRRDFADGVERPQITVTVPDLPPGPTPVSVRDGATSLLDVSLRDFTVLQAPLVLAEANQTTVARCYRAAVAADGTAYFPFDVSAISDRTLFSGAVRGYRLTFGAADIAIYNAQGVLMQLLGPGQSSIFDISDDGGSNAAAEHTRWTRSRVRVADATPTTTRVDFDADPAGDLARFKVGTDPGRDAFLPLVDGGVGGSGGLLLAPASAVASAPRFAGLLDDDGQLSHPGDTIATSVDVDFGAGRKDDQAFVGMLGIGGSRIALRVVAEEPLASNDNSGPGSNSGSTTGRVRASVVSGSDDTHWSRAAQGDGLDLQPGWYRLRLTLTYTDGGLAFLGELATTGTDGLGPETVVTSLTGTLPEPPGTYDTPLRGFGGQSGTPLGDALVPMHFDDFTDVVTPAPPPSDGGGDTPVPDDVDRSIKSFRLSYDRHEFVTYRAQHAIDEAFFIDPTDLAWHLNGTRHIDHDHLVIAVKARVAEESSLVPGATPPFDLAITTTVADAPPVGPVPEVIQQRSCDATPPVPAICSSVPRTGCATAMHAPSGTRLVVDGPGGDAATLAWSWHDWQASAPSRFGDPMHADPVAFCVYDESGASAQLVAAAAAPAAATCGGRGRRHGRSCWHAGDAGVVYRDPRAASGGLSDIRMTASRNGTAIALSARGANLELPSLPLPTPLRVQLQSGAGQCWEARYLPHDVRAAGARRWKAATHGR